MGIRKGRFEGTALPQQFSGIGKEHAKALIINRLEDSNLFHEIVKELINLDDLVPYVEWLRLQEVDCHFAHHAQHPEVGTECRQVLIVFRL